jgi:hypothetical protein
MNHKEQLTREDVLKAKLIMDSDKAIIDRLEYVEENYAGEVELWRDPETDTYYHVPLTILRDWDNCEQMDKQIIDRLEFFEETFVGEIETWVDPVTKAYYQVPIEIVRDFARAYRNRAGL